MKTQIYISKAGKTFLGFFICFILFIALPLELSAYAEGESLVSGETSIDTSELTDEDWSQIQEELSSTLASESEVETSAESTDSPFETIKSSDGTNGNDGGILLVLGLGLIVVGVVLLACIIYFNIRGRIPKK